MPQRGARDLPRRNGRRAASEEIRTPVRRVRDPDEGCRMTCRHKQTGKNQNDRSDHIGSYSLVKRSLHRPAGVPTHGAAADHLSWQRTARLKALQHSTP